MKFSKNISKKGMVAVAFLVAMSFVASGALLSYYVREEISGDIQFNMLYSTDGVTWEPAEEILIITDRDIKTGYTQTGVFHLKVTGVRPQDVDFVLTNVNEENGVEFHIEKTEDDGGTWTTITTAEVRRVPNEYYRWAIAIDPLCSLSCYSVIIEILPSTS